MNGFVRNIRVRLITAFTALLCFQMSHMRLCFMNMERAGLLEYENLVFILYCFGIVCGLAIAPLLTGRLRAAVFVRVCLAVAAAFTVVGYFASGYAALTIQFATMLFYSGALAAVLREASASLSPRLAGRLYSIAGAVMHIVTMAVFYQPFVPVSSGAVAGILCAFLAVAAVSFTAAANPPVRAAVIESAMPFSNYAPLKPRIVHLGMAVLGLFVVFGGLQDNIYYFDSVFADIPNLHFFIFTYNAFIYLAAGFLFERVDPALAAVGALALICASQSMALFSMYNFLAYPYTVLSNAGYIVMEVYLFMLPVAYVAHTGKKPGILPGLGFMTLYTSFSVMAMIFGVLPPAFYGPARGVMLLVAVAAILVTVYLMHENKLHRLKLLQDELKDLKNKPASMYESSMLAESLTDREQEVVQFILAGKPIREIGAAMNIGESTVKFHLGNIYSKYGVANRAELIALLLTSKKPID